MKKKKLTAYLCAAACVAAAVSGCGAGKVKTKSAEIIYPDGGVYPMQCNDKLTVW